MTNHSRQITAAAIALITATCGTLPVQAQEKVLNLYSARHYQTDDAMYEQFTKTTGIKINRVDADDAGILARLKAEGAASHADAVLLVDAARMALADSQGLFRPSNQSARRGHSREPARHTHGRGRDMDRLLHPRPRDRVRPPARQGGGCGTYEQLADPKLKGLLCTRSGSHPYNLSLLLP